MFTCNETGHVAVLDDDDTRVAEFPLVCNDNGEFEQTWPKRFVKVQEVFKQSDFWSNKSMNMNNHIIINIYFSRPIGR